MSPLRRPLGIVLGILIALPSLSYLYSRFSPAVTTREIHIAASPDRVWAVLTDFESYADWNPHLVQAAGEAVPGTRLAITIREGEDTTDFTPLVLVAAPGSELRWRGSFLFPGLADGTHSFRLHPAGKGTRLVQSESFTGVLGPFTPVLFDLSVSFAAANEALRQRVEHRE